MSVNYNSPIKEIAKQIRAEIKQAKADEMINKSTKVSVRIECYSMGCTLHVNITSVGYRIHNEDWIAFTDAHPHHWHGDPCCPEHRYTPIARQEAKKIDRIVRQYHSDRSDSQTDYYCVNFSYTGCGFHYDLLGPDKERVREQIAADTVVVKDVPKMRIIEYEPADEEGDEPVTYTAEVVADLLDFAQLESDRDHALEELEHAQACYDKINERHLKAVQVATLREAAKAAQEIADKHLADAKDLERALCDLPN